MAILIVKKKEPLQRVTVTGERPFIAKTLAFLKAES